MKWLLESRVMTDTVDKAVWSKEMAGVRVEVRQVHSPNIVKAYRWRVLAGNKALDSGWANFPNDAKYDALTAVAVYAAKLEDDGASAGTVGAICQLVNDD